VIPDEAIGDSSPVVIPPTGPGALAIPMPLVRSVGEIAGLSPRRHRSDGGEVPAADVDLVDALPPGEWELCAAWLRAQKQAGTRRTYLADLAAFLRWLTIEVPGLGLTTVTEDVLVHYRDTIGTGQARAGVGRPGLPLAPATVARRLSTMSSLYKYMRRRIHRANPVEDVPRPDVGDEGTTPALSPTEAEALIVGCENIAAKYPADAAVVALMLIDGLRVGEAVALTVGAIAPSAGHYVITFTRKGGRVAALPIPPRAYALLGPLLEGRSPRDLLFTTDGVPWDRWRVGTALNRAARAAGIDASRLTPHVMRTTAATMLLDAGVPLRDVQDHLGHRRPDTTRRYDRGGRKLDGHPAYRMAALLSGGS